MRNWAGNLEFRSTRVEKPKSVVELAAEPEVGGVACRSYQHTLALLLALE